MIEKKKVLVYPSITHYQSILRSVIGVILFIGLMLMIELDVLPPWADFLNDRRGFIGALELILSLLSFLAVAVGLDKLLFPLLKKLSNKDPIQLTDEGVRFHYRGSHADVRFSDMEKVTKLKESAGFDIHTTNGQVIEISGYADMSIIEQHLKQKLLD